MTHTRLITVPFLAALVLTSCGSETTGSTDSPKAADSSSTPSPTESQLPVPAPSGTLRTKPVPCDKFATAAGFRQAGAAPPVMCAFESEESRVTVTVGAGPRSFEQLKQGEDNAAMSNGVTPPVLEEVMVDGWTFAAIWPEFDGFNRMDRYLVDTAGNVLTCKVGVQGGKVDETTQAAFCESARGLLHTP